MYSELRKRGNLGEDIACKYLIKMGFLILERNVLEKWGEIDIVASKGKILHFVEVKSVSREYLGNDRYKPEDNMHPAKLKRLRRVIQTYLLGKKGDPDWQFDVIAVYLNDDARKARVELMEDIVL